MAYCICRGRIPVAYADPLIIWAGFQAEIHQKAAKSGPETRPSKVYHHFIQTCCYVPYLPIAFVRCKCRGL